MSGFEMKPVDEAQFDAFLQGKDDLSRLLREIPQPKSSPSMDAAILALVTADLGEEGSDPHDFSNSTAANEAVFDSKQPAISSKKSFLEGWRAPFGLAASALLAISMWHFVGKNSRDVELAQVEESYPQAAPAAAAPSAPADSKKRLEQASEAANAVRSALPAPKDSAQKPVLAKSAKKAPPEVLEKTVETELAKAKSVIQEKHSDQVIAYAGEAKPVLRAAPQADEAAPASSQKAEVGVQTNGRREMAAEAAERVQLAKSMAKADESAKISEKSVAKNALAAPSVVAAAPVAAAPPPPPAPVASSVLPSAEHLARAKAWASLVEELLKANMKQEALEEWLKFRKVYPNYQVSERLQEQIKILQSGNTKTRSERD